MVTLYELSLYPIAPYKYPCIKIVGFMEFPEEMQPFIEEGRITFAPFVDFVELQRLIAEVDVNIFPLVQNTFTNCKSQLKFFEAARDYSVDRWRGANFIKQMEKAFDFYKN